MMKNFLLKYFWSKGVSGEKCLLVKNEKSGKENSGGKKNSGEKNLAKQNSSKIEIKK